MKRIIKGEETFLQLALIVMSVLALTQVFTRYVLQISIVWIEEATRYLMVWLVFIGMALAVSRKAHLGVELVEYLLPPSAAKKIYIFLNSILLIFGVIFSGLTWKVIVFQMELGQKSPGMQISMAVVYLGMLAGGILFTIHIANQLYSNFRSAAPEVTGEEGEF